MDISQENIDLATNFFLGDSSLFNKKDKDYQNLFLSYASDNNASSIRELVTLSYLNYNIYTQKHGADGFDPATNRIKEVKPRFIKEKKVSSTGNFNDLTLDLLDKKKDYDIICSLFTPTKAVYIVEFPISLIMEKLKKSVINARQGSRVQCHWSWNSYDSDKLIVHYFDKDYAKEVGCLAKAHYKMLESRIKT
jgi:hypothetical protein